MRDNKGRFMKGNKKPENAYKFQKGHKKYNLNPTWNKGKNISGMSGKNHSENTKIQMSISMTGKEHNSLNNLTKFKKGDIRLVGNKINLGKTGEKSGNWKGGITPLNKILRTNSMFKIWREAVFLCDNFICQNPNCEYCHNLQGVYLHAHHKKPFALFPELRFVISNGITYCKGFHLSSGLHKEMKITLYKIREVK